MNMINDNINVISTFFLSLISRFLCLYVNESGPNQTIVKCPALQGGFWNLPDSHTITGKQI